MHRMPSSPARRPAETAVDADEIRAAQAARAALETGGSALNEAVLYRFNDVIRLASSNKGKPTPLKISDIDMLAMRRAVAWIAHADVFGRGATAEEGKALGLDGSRVDPRDFPSVARQIVQRLARRRRRTGPGRGSCRAVYTDPRRCEHRRVALTMSRVLAIALIKLSTLGATSTVMQKASWLGSVRSIMDHLQFRACGVEV